MVKMRLSTLVLPVYAFSAFALVIPSTEDTKNTVAGPTDFTNHTEEVTTALASLDSEYERLEELKQELLDLHHKVLRQEHDILVLINKDYASCSGLKCYLQTAIQKAPDYFTLVKTHFRHPKNSTSSACPPKGKPLGSEVHADNDTDSKIPPDVLVDFLETDTVPISATEPGDGNIPSDRPPFASEHGVPPYGQPHPGPPTPFDHANQPFEFDLPDYQGPPTQFSHPEYNPEKPNPASPAERPYDGPGHHHRPHFPTHMPHPAPRHRHFKLILTVASMIIIGLILAVFFKAVRIYLSNPRVQADRAARREECRTKREYRRAACQHRLRQCLSRFRRQRRDSGTGDYEEKRAMLQQRRSDSNSSIASHIVGADINSLRRAHEIVDQLMRAEEGRQSNQRRRSSSTGSSEVASSSRSMRSLQTTRTVTTLPPYAPPPPRYSTEISREMEVVDGFRYTPAQGIVTPCEFEVASSASSFVLNDEDLRTESSVVDCQSRMSMETNSIPPSIIEESDRRRCRKSLELAGDIYRGRFN